MDLLLLLLLLLMVYYKIIELESELRSYLQTLVKNIKKYLVLQALYYNNCLLIYELISETRSCVLFVGKEERYSCRAIAKKAKISKSSVSLL
jgi:hypothetical protein